MEKRWLRKPNEYVRKDGYVVIVIWSRGKRVEALIDEADEAIARSVERAWCLRRTKQDVYVFCNVEFTPTHKTVDLARLLMNPKDDELVDHRDGNGLDNRRSNLRNVSNQVNTSNRKHTTAMSGMRGVYRLKHRDLWAARVKQRGGGLMRYFKTQEQAERAVSEYLESIGVPITRPSTRKK